MLNSNQILFVHLAVGKEFFVHGKAPNTLRRCTKVADGVFQEQGKEREPMEDDEIVMLRVPNPMRIRPGVPFVGELNAHQREALRILGEECNEVGQAVSKVCRVGPEYIPLQQDTPNGVLLTTQELLELEVGDVLCLIDEAVKSGILRPEALEKRRQSKPEKLWVWTHYLGRAPSPEVEAELLKARSPQKG